MAAKLAGLEQKVTELSAENQQLRTEVSSLKSQVAELKTEVGKQSPALTVKEIKEIKERNRKLDADIEDFMLSMMEDGGFDPEIACRSFEDQADALAEMFPEL